MEIIFEWISNFCACSKTFYAEVRLLLKHVLWMFFFRCCMRNRKQTRKIPIPWKQMRWHNWADIWGHKCLGESWSSSIPKRSKPSVEECATFKYSAENHTHANSASQLFLAIVKFKSWICWCGISYDGTTSRFCFSSNCFEVRVQACFRVWVFVPQLTFEC